jgi:hypothetical protein
LKARLSFFDVEEIMSQFKGLDGSVDEIMAQFKGLNG